MLSGKILFTLIGLILAFFALGSNTQPLVENWMGIPHQGPTAQPYAVASNGSKTALSGNFFDPAAYRGSGKFVSVPSFQSIISPRFSNVQYGANIRYNMPDRENLASPCNPLTFGDMAKENYASQQPVKENYGCGTGQCGSKDSAPSCGKGGYGLGHKVAGGYELPVGYTNGNYNDVYNSLGGDVVSKPCVDDPTASALPVGTMNTMDSMGNPDQFVVFNRLMNVNLTGSRLRSQGDPIRGDLAVTPCQSGWFSVYPTPARDLQTGALNVLAGYDAGDSNAKLMELMMNSTGGARTTYGGVNFADAPPVNMTPQYGAVLSAASSDVNVTAFP